MSIDCSFAVSLIVLNLFHFAITAVMPIYNKEFFKIAPYPIFVTLLQIIVSIPIAFVIAWIKNGFGKDFRWLIPPKHSLGHLIYSSFSYGFMLAIGNLGLFMSNIDYAVLIRLSGLVWQGFLAFIFLGEKLSCFNFCSVVLVMIGIIIMTTNFNKSSSHAPSFLQFGLQMLTIMFTSLSSISLKKLMNDSSNTETKCDLLTIHFWRFLIASIPMAVLGLVLEPAAWINAPVILSKQCMVYTCIGVVLSQTFQFIGLKLQTMTTVMTLAVISQLKFLPTLVLSHYLYNETPWSNIQLIGALLLCTGAVSYSLSRVFGGDNGKKNENEQKTHLLDMDQPEEEEIDM